MTDSAHRPHRRTLLSRGLALSTATVWGGLGCALSPPAHAVRPRADSPTVAIDPLLVDTGLAARWARAMRQDLGWAAQWLATPSAQVLDQLESGQSEVGLFLSLPRAATLEKDGLIHDRRTLARTEVWLVGPSDDPAGIRNEKDPARAIAQILAAQAAGVAAFQTGPAGQPHAPQSPLAQLAERLMGSASTAGLSGKNPARSAPARAAPLYQLVTQAGWLHQGGGKASAARVWFQGHPAMVLNAEVARSFRGKHPGARMLVDWLDRPLARNTLRGAAGWQSTKG